MRESAIRTMARARALTTHRKAAASSLLWLDITDQNYPLDTAFQRLGSASTSGEKTTVALSQIVEALAPRGDTPSSTARRFGKPLTPVTPGTLRLSRGFARA